MTDPSQSPSTEGSEERDDGKLLDEYTEQDAGVTKDRWGDPVVGSQWFLLSTKWLKQWKLYKGKVNTTGLDVDTRSPGPIDNSDIQHDPSAYYRTSEGSNLDTALRPGAALNLDYSILPPKAWHLLTSIYGVKDGSTMVRYSTQQTATQTYVELALRELKLCVVKGDYELVEPKSVYISRRQKVKELYERTGKVLGVAVPPGALITDIITLWELDTNTGLDGLKDRIRLKTENKPVELLGKRLTRLDESIDDAELPMMAIVIVEIRPAVDRNWLFSREVNQFRCEGCRKPAYGTPVKCDCGKVSGM